MDGALSYLPILHLPRFDPVCDPQTKIHTCAPSHSQKILSVSTRCAETAYKTWLFLKEPCEHAGWAERRFTAHLPFFSATLFLTLSLCPLSLSPTQTHTLVTIKQVVLSSRLSPCWFLGATHEPSQLFLTAEPQLTPHTCSMLVHALAHVLFTFSGSFSLRLPFSYQLTLQSNLCSRAIYSSYQCLMTALYFFL